MRIIIYALCLSDSVCVCEIIYLHLGWQSMWSRLQTNLWHSSFSHFSRLSIVWHSLAAAASSLRFFISFWPWQMPNRRKAYSTGSISVSSKYRSKTITAKYIPRPAFFSSLLTTEKMYRQHWKWRKVNKTGRTRAHAHTRTQNTQNRYLPSTPLIIFAHHFRTAKTLFVLKIYQTQFIIRM